MTRLALVLVLVAATAVPGWAQPPVTPTPTPAPTATTTQDTTPGTIAIPTVQHPGVLFPPFVGADVFIAPLAQGPLILTPSLTISEEWNDNVFSDNANKESDFITQFTPALRLDVRQPGLQASGGYSFTAEIYARNSELSDPLNRQRLFGDVVYQATPRLTLTLTESLGYDKNSNAASVEGISSGRQETWSNVLSPALRYEVTPRLGWSLYGAYELQRYQSAGSQDSDIYRVGTGLDYAVTPRFRVTGGYDFAYLDIDGEPTGYTHTPRVGFSYQITQTLTAAVSGGPSFFVSEGDTTVSPAVNASLTQAQRWGSLGVFYDRAIRSGGGLGGASDSQSVGGFVSVTTLAKGFSLGFSPRYTMSKSEDVGRNDSDVKALNLNLNASYQIARYISLVGSYTFFNQRTDGGNGGTVGTGDIDQNRVSIGLQFGYPISFD